MSFSLSWCNLISSDMATWERKRKRQKKNKKKGKAAL
jgi:hypothetical protein